MRSTSAARLEQAAQPNEILIGDDTYDCTWCHRHAAKPRLWRSRESPEPIVAYALNGLTGAPSRRNEVRMVGRGTELRRLQFAYDQALRDRSCQMFTILGNAGVGKSRLVAEFLSSIDATIVRGRCLPYGEGITYSR